eukprot:TRINITY_DN9666_c0_g1_i1.p1 TRINITY_DN9666_c0_g1~~TRINITY_DN9666_c0_g1_i1.p1  ORF type:complete len:878 (+),score=262.07 TRINITY_DN9666_c0_g1_i1:99-2732(+)
MSWRDRGKGRDWVKGKGGKGKDEDTSNDWECDNCKARNFARRQECFKCGGKRPRRPEDDEDPVAARERKLKVAIAMGYDAEMAETVILDPRFSESIAQYEKMIKAQEEEQKAQEAQMQQVLSDPRQLMAAAMAEGLNQEQAAAYVQQYMAAKKAQEEAEKQQQQQPAADVSGAPPDPRQILAAAMAQGYTQEQAEQYVQQYLAQWEVQKQQQQQQAAAATSSATPATSSQAPAAPPAERKARFASVPLILNIEEGRRDEWRATLKAVIYTDGGGRKAFRDVFFKGPWRRRKAAAMKDQQVLAEEFKYEGEKGVEAKLDELDDKEWKREDLAEFASDKNNEAQAEPDEDDFDAEAEAAKEEPEPEMDFNNMELPVKARGVINFGGPVHTWEEGVARGCVAPIIQQGLAARGLLRPTLIQRFSLPLISNPKVDLLAQAQTGSGKTLAFVIPIVSRLVANPPIPRPYFAGAHAQASPIALMLAPTRELAIQTSQCTTELLQAAGSSMISLTMYGGEALSHQVKPIERQQQDIICATAGRLLDAIDAGKVSLSFLTVLVLDEADQMMDLAVGLEGTVMQITDGRDMPRKEDRQTLLFSATMPDFQTRQFYSVLKAPPLRARIRVGHYAEDEKGGSCRHIRQEFVRVRHNDECWDRLGRDLMQVWGPPGRRMGKGILFTNRIVFSAQLERTLAKSGITAGQLHGKQTQDVREDVVKRFRAGEFEMLIASNVASRGLDFPDIRIVVQFELPKTVEIYTHRVGRTGRTDPTTGIVTPGVAIAYFQDADRALAKPLSDFLRLNDQAVPRWLDDITGRARSRSRSRDRGSRSDGKNFAWGGGAGQAAGGAGWGNAGGAGGWGKEGNWGKGDAWGNAGGGGWGKGGW